MMEFGKSLKAAREAKGLTVAQLVEVTHLAPTTIAELENEDFSHIAAPIYGRGFVKLYCEAVGLDPKPLVNEFMEIFSGNHDATIRERPVAPSESVSVEPAPTEPAAPSEPVPAEPVAAEPPTANPAYGADSLFASDPLFAPERNSCPEPVTASEPPSQPPIVPQPQALSPQPANDHAFSRYAAPIRQWKPVVTTSAWRLGVLILPAIALLVLIVLGVKALYRATASAPAAPDVAETPAKETAEQHAADVSAKSATAAPGPSHGTSSPTNVRTDRAPQPTPALYVD